MALQKSITSERTGATTTYHEVSQVTIDAGRATALVASYPDKAAKDAGKRFSELTTVSLAYDGSALAKAPLAWAQDGVKATEKFAGATEVA